MFIFRNDHLFQINNIKSRFNSLRRTTLSLFWLTSVWTACIRKLKMITSLRNYDRLIKKVLIEIIFLESTRANISMPLFETSALLKVCVFLEKAVFFSNVTTAVYHSVIRLYCMRCLQFYHMYIRTACYLLKIILLRFTLVTVKNLCQCSCHK